MRSRSVVTRGKQCILYFILFIVIDRPDNGSVIFVFVSFFYFFFFFFLVVFLPRHIKINRNRRREREREPQLQEEGSIERNKIMVNTSLWRRGRMKKGWREGEFCYFIASFCLLYINDNRAKNLDGNRTRLTRQRGSESSQMRRENKSHRGEGRGVIQPFIWMSSVWPKHCFRTVGCCQPSQ